ncbi:MAG TPA: MOSC N-terminal beta barrel domain-containing protein [Micromonosporaceae bacterium]|nr:MOSC N-terminal beta barrel domain-containing protein [Micromonosporaceae bacterium]
MAASVLSLTCYPVKGCAGVSLRASEAAEMGLRHDRAFLVVDGEGTFRSQRRTPAMAVIRPSVTEDGTHLTVTAPGAAEAVLPVVVDGDRRAVTMFGRPLGTAVDQGDAAARWFSEVLGAPSRLVRVPPEFDRDGWGEHPGKVGFADAHAVLITSSASLDELNRRIVQGGAEPVPMDRFRPNIVVTGWDEPHTEDRIRLLSVGGVRLGYAARAIRCSVPLVDQETGRRSGPEPIRSLAGYRREPSYGGGVSFGVKAAVLRAGRVAVGDEVRVEDWQP